MDLNTFSILIYKWLPCKKNWFKETKVLFKTNLIWISNHVEIQNMGKFKTNEILNKYKMATKTKAKMNIPLYHTIFMHFTEH
jgi:nucleoid DNA-binding protein